MSLASREAETVPWVVVVSVEQGSHLVGIEWIQNRVRLLVLQLSGPFRDPELRQLTQLNLCPTNLFDHNLDLSLGSSISVSAVQVAAHGDRNRPEAPCTSGLQPLHSLCPSYCSLP